MSDLISRSELIRHVESEYRAYGEDYDVEQILGDIEDMPTTYDIDKVIEELEKSSKWINETNGYCDDGNDYIPLSKAIEIVKNGGVSDDVCEWEKDEHSENDNPAEWIICPHKPKRIFSKDIKYCPYCGKKIKAVE